MKKVISILLSVLMAFSAITVGVVAASAAEEDIALPAGSKIFFDNTNTQWDAVYFYAWNYGYFGDSVPMTQVDDTNIYEIVVPVAVPAGAEYFLFKSAADWSGSQTANQSAQVGVNTYAPSADASTVVTSHRDYPVETEVAITPYSKTFTGTLDVTVYAFNAESATYQVGSAAPVAFTDTATITLDATSTVTVTAGTASTSCEFTKIQDAIITVDAGKYTGDMYVYTYGGDRVAPGFAPMKYDAVEKEYTYILNGTAHVIFTTTDDWSTAVKFIIEDSVDQEPFVDKDVYFTVSLPEPEPTTAPVA